MSLFLISITVIAAESLAYVSPGQPIPTGPPSSLVYMQVLAHEDDDFLFMNPDIANQITAGVTSISIYLTAGQSCGVGDCTDGSDTVPPLVLTREEFAAARQSGIRAAYAQMAGAANSWIKTLVQPDGNYTVELYTLAAAPRVKLIFMDLPDGGDVITLHENALYHLFSDTASIYLTDNIVPVCDSHTNAIIGPNVSCDYGFNSPPVPHQVYNRAGVVSTLSALLQMYQPVEVRTLDPQPFQKLAIAGTETSPFCGGNDQRACQFAALYNVSYDNLDHTSTARFVDELLANYHGPNQTGRYSVIHYKGYSTPDFPANLGEADYIGKSATALAYLPYDPNYVQYQDGYVPYYHRVWERYPGSTNWVQRANDGRLVAANVEDRRVKIWYESLPGGPWVGPVSIWTGSPLSPHVTLLKRPDGLLQIFALRLPLEREQFSPSPNTPLQDVVTTIQLPNPRPRASLLTPITFGPWQSLGSPDAGVGNCSEPCQFVGPPTAAIDGTGRTFVFAKNSQGLVSYIFSGTSNPPCITETDVNCTFWNSSSFANQVQAYVGDIPVQQDIVDGIAAITRNDGLIEVFATLRTGRMWHFVQDFNSTHFTYDGTYASIMSASSPTVAKNQDGQVQTFFREAADSSTGNPGARVLTVPGNPFILYGDAGGGPVAAIQREFGGQIMLFERNIWDGISETHQVAPNGDFTLIGLWSILGGPLNEYAASATDTFGRTVVVAKGLDGNLYIRRELTPFSIGVFGSWTRVGGATPLRIKN